MVFNVFGSRDLPRDPQETQEPPKKHPKSSKGPCKKLPKKIPKNASVVKNALSRRSALLTKNGTNFRTQICTCFKHVLHIFFTTFSKNVETHFGTHFGIRVAQEGQDEPKRAIRSFKEPKTFIFKNLKKPFGFLKVFGYRGLSRKPQEAEEGSQKAPKKSKTPKNRNPKLRPKIIKKIGTNFGAHSETQAQPK